MITCKLYPLTPHNIVKLGFTGVYIFFLFLLLNIDRLSVPSIYVFSKKKKHITLFHLKITNFTAIKIAVYCIGEFALPDTSGSAVYTEPKL